MIWINKQKFFSRYLPIALSVIILAVVGFWYVVYITKAGGGTGGNGTHGFYVQQGGKFRQVGGKVEIGGRSNSSNVTFASYATSGEVTTAGATTSSISVSGANPVLVIGTSILLGGGTGSTTAVTFSGGGTATLVNSATVGSSGYADLWCIPAPPAGTGTVHASFTTNFGPPPSSYVVAMVFNGADQSNPCPTSDSVATTSSVSNTSITLAPSNFSSGDASVGMVGLYNSGDVTSPYIQNNTIYENIGGNSDTETGYSTSTASVTANWQSGAGSYKTFVVARVKHK